VGLLPLPRIAAGRRQPVHHRDGVQQPGAGRVPRAVHQLQLGQRGFAGQPQPELPGELLVAGRPGQPDDGVGVGEGAYQDLRVGVDHLDHHPGRAQRRTLRRLRGRVDRVGAQQIPRGGGEQPGRKPR
jgi:hypothetical protein